MSTPKDTVTFKLRMIGCSPAKSAVSLPDPDRPGEYKTEMRESVQIHCGGVKDPFFGPATPSASFNATVANPEAARMFRKAFEQYHLECHETQPNPYDDAHPWGTAGVELDVTVRIAGPSFPDTYP